MSPQAQLRLDPSSAAPAYAQIADQLRAYVVEGVLKSNDTLPPVRRLALDLGIHFNTVAEAYRTLAQEGLLEIVHGHGARVVDRQSSRPVPSDVSDTFQQRLRELIATFRTRGLTPRGVAVELKIALEALKSQ